MASIDPWEFRRQDYSLDRDQQDVRDAFSEFFLKESSSSVVRAAEPLGYDARLWAALVDMGVTTMSLPAAAGGDDATLVELVLIAEELGRTAAPVPYVSHVVSTRLLAAVAAADEIIEAVAFQSRPSLLPAGKINAFLAYLHIARSAHGASLDAMDAGPALDSDFLARSDYELLASAKVKAAA